MSKRGRPLAPRVTFEAVRQAPGIWQVLAVGADTGYKFKTVYVFKHGDDAQFMAQTLNDLQRTLTTDIDHARFRRLHLEGAP